MQLYFMGTFMIRQLSNSCNNTKTEKTQMKKRWAFTVNDSSFSNRVRELLTLSFFSLCTVNVQSGFPSMFTHARVVADACDWGATAFQGGFIPQRCQPSRPTREQRRGHMRTRWCQFTRSSGWKHCHLLGLGETRGHTKTSFHKSSVFPENSLSHYCDIFSLTELQFSAE